MRTKRFLSIVLTFAMLVGMFPGTSLTTYAEGNTTEITPTNTSGTMNITLTIAAHVHDDISFKAWTATDSMPTEAGNYYLANDVTISSTWSVPTGMTNLCLNGHGIIMSGTNRVITVSSGSTLNLYDCGTEAVHKFTVTNPSDGGAGLAKVNDGLENGYQTFTGGYITGGQGGQGGGVYIAGGTFNMHGGNIIGNHAQGSMYYDGGGVALSENTNSRFVMTGGAIQYNTSVGRGGGLGIMNNATVELSGDAKIAYNRSNNNDWGGGISSFGALSISGNVKITNNKGASALHPQQGSLNISGAPVIFDNEVTANVLPEVMINVTGTLTEGAKLGVYWNNVKVFTNSTDTSFNDVSKFVSDNPNYSVMKNADGQLYLGAGYTVTFNAGGHGTAPDAQTVVSGEKATKPTDLTAEGYVFDGWYKEEALTNEWDFDNDTVTGNITLYAKWRQAISYAVTFKVINGKWDDDSIADKTVTLTGYEGDTLKLTADQIPAVGTKPNDTYKAGSWDVMPSVNTAITEATTYTYTYAAKEASVVTKAPEAKTLTYTGGPQALVTAGTATGGTIRYALGTATEATGPYTSSIPTATDAGTYYVWYRVSPDDAHIGTAPACVTVTIAKKTITISGITAANKEFDNTTAATLVYTGIDWAACGMVDGDTLTVTATGSFADANAGTAKTVSITGLTLGGSSVANYVLAASGQQEETTADITLKALTGIAAANVEVTYDGAEHTITVTGVPAGATVTYGTSTDSITMTQAPVFVDANEAANTVYYKVSCTNYSDFTGSATVKINKKAATITANASGKTYGSGEDPELTATVSGTIGTEVLNYILSREAGENVGGYAITVTPGTNPNYEVTVNDGTFTISKKAATVTAIAAGKIYGSTDPVLSATVEGLVGTDALNYTLSRVAGENVGEYAITVTLGTNPNYDITAVNGTFTIEKATLTTVGAENVIATYDGGEHTITVTGIPAGATVTYGTSVDDITLTQAPTFVNAGETANTVYYKVSGSNYNDFVGSATVRINKRDVTITADDKSSKYGADLQALTYQISSGSIVAGDDLGIELSTTASNTSYVNAYTITVYWNGNTNYNATLENGTYTITRADLTVSASGYNGIYDGAAHGITVDVGTSGEIVYYAETELTEANYNVAGSTVAPTYVNAGIYTVYYYVVPTNYDPQPVKGSMAVNIAQKALTITADSDSKSYDTTALTKNSYTNTTLVAGDSMESVTVTGTQTNVGSSANVPSNAVIKNGTTDVTANYDITYVNGTLTVTQALTNNVTVDVTGWTYGESANAPTSTADFGATTVVYSYSDAADGTFTAAVPTTAGTWYVKAYVAGTENYVQGEAVKSFVIARKALTITARSDTKVYDGSAITKNSYTNTALATGDEITSISITGLQLNVGSSANVPSNAIIKKGTTDVTDNYSITYANGTLTVTKAMTNNVTVAITGWTYGDSANAPSSTADFGTDTVTYTYSDKADGTFTATAPTHAGLWFVKAYVAGTENFVEGSAITSFNIAKKAVTVTADAKEKTYGDADPALTYVPTGLVGNDTLTGALARAEGENVGTYAITQGTVDSNDYAITYVGADLTVNRREIVISNILAKDKKPDGTTDATLDYSFVVFGNIMAADDGKLSVTAVGTFEDAEIGNDKTVAITGLTLGGEAVGNYVLAASGQQTATTADVSNMAEEDSADGSFRAEVKDFEGFTPQVSGLTIDLAKSLCTPAELAVYNAGGKLELELEIGLAGAAMTDDVVTMVTNAVRDQKNAKLDGAIYLDISLYKVLNGVRTKVTNLNGKYLTITLKVPEDMKNNIWENKRTFYVVQVHSGAANVLSDTIDMTVSFDTDRFSTYALSFADTSIITYGASTGAGTAGGTGAAATVVAPKTYGESVSEKWLVLFGTVSAVIGIVTGVYSFRRKKEEE